MTDAAVVGLRFSLFTQDNIKLTTKYINAESFSSQTTVLLQLTNISKEYRLQFSHQAIPREIDEKWNNPIEGFDEAGAFFQFHEQGGVKIKNGGSIEVNNDYYLLSQDDPRQSLDDSLVEKVGEIIFTTDYWTKFVFNVYRIKINSITKLNQKFCLERRVLLVSGSSKINPLWPPCNKQEQFYIYDQKREHKQTVFFLLKAPVTTGSEHHVLTYPNRNIRIMYEKRRKSLGNKRNDIPVQYIAEITKIYGDFTENEISKIFRNEEFGYAKIVVERPMVDENGQPVLKKGQVQPDSNLRDTENVPLTEDIDSYFAREVLPFAPDAWIDKSKTKIGYEIPLTRYFYKYIPPQPARDIMAEILEIEKELDGALKAVFE
ncbi:MAG: hypothetical protein GX434_12810 [Peptococcaceae bacterium]|nr:hypothetical protein [Peptococcaceae bacterium]